MTRRTVAASRQPGVQNASPRPQAGRRAPERVGAALQGTNSVPGPSTGRSWFLWFPVRLGPPRKKSKSAAGVKVTAKVRGLELPPTKNTKHGNPFSHAAWVKEWRDEAKHMATGAGIPPCGRIRLSAVVYRKAIGVADAENDHARLAPLQDGLVDAGVVPKDTYAYVERGSVTEERAGIAGPGVLLIVEVV